jgi:hypothetical protein
MAGVQGRAYDGSIKRFRLLASVIGGLCVAAARAVSAPNAHAGILVASAGNCEAQPLERPFVRWLDPLSYTLVPGGTLEGGATGWTLSKASVVSGNESFYVHGAGETKSLSLPAGSSATTRAMCFGLGHPTLRFFARSSGSLLSSLKVEVLFETSAGSVVAAPIGVVTPSSAWRPTLPMAIVANLLPLLPGERTPVAFRFKPQGNAGWWIDDVYVDPSRR